MTDNIPTFEVKIKNNIAYFTCPKCKRKIEHGGAKGLLEYPDLVHHRIAHCDCWPDGYYLATKHSIDSKQKSPA